METYFFLGGDRQTSSIGSILTFWNLLRLPLPKSIAPDLLSLPVLILFNSISDLIIFWSSLSEASEALELLLNSQRRAQTLNDYQEMRQSLGEEGVCNRAAQAILDLVLTRKSKSFSDI